MKYKFPLATTSWDVNEYNAMQKVINSGIFTMGNYVETYEKNFASYVGSNHCIMVNSGSSAIVLMIASLFYTKDKKHRIERGDEVIVPAVSWSTTYYPLYQYGLKIKFVDVNLETLNYDLDQLNQAITSKTRIVLAVNLLGNPNDFSVINEMINGKDIILLEDNCESMGAEFLGKQAGTFGLMGCFSSFFSHHISTMEGGLVVTNDDEIHQILLSLRAHGWTRNLPKNNLVCTTKSDDEFTESYRFVLPGYNFRPLELEGAIGIEQVKKLPSLIAERQKNAKLMQNRIGDHPYLMLQKEIGSSSWFGFSLLLKRNSKITRPELVTRLKKVGFECRPIVAGNFAKNQVLKYFDYCIHGSLNNADYIDRNGVFIGNHHYPINDAIDALCTI